MPTPGITTLGTIRATCQQQSDNVNAGFIATTEWNGWIQTAYQELYGIIVTKFGNDYFWQTPNTGYTFVTDGVSQFFALPSDFFKGIGVDLQISAPNYWVPLKPFNVGDRNRLSITNSTIPQGGQTLRIFYAPRCTVPVADSDTIDGVNGWEDYIVAKVVAIALAKEESDPSLALQRVAAMEKRIEEEAENRDAGSPATIADTYGRRARAMQYRFAGNNIWLIGNGMPGWGPFGDWGSDYDSGGGWF